MSHTNPLSGGPSRPEVQNRAVGQGVSHSVSSAWPPPAAACPAGVSCHCPLHSSRDPGLPCRGLPGKDCLRAVAAHSTAMSTAQGWIFGGVPLKFPEPEEAVALPAGLLGWGGLGFPSLQNVLLPSQLIWPLNLWIHPSSNEKRW